MTDANLALGRLNSESFLGGRLGLDADLAREAIRRRIADPLGMTVEEAAEGIVRVVNAGMIKGIRVVSVAKGYDPREFCLVTFGGAGPVHASELAAELDIPRVLVPIAPRRDLGPWPAHGGPARRPGPHDTEAVGRAGSVRAQCTVRRDGGRGRGNDGARRRVPGRRGAREGCRRAGTWVRASSWRRRSAQGT